MRMFSTGLFGEAEDVDSLSVYHWNRITHVQQRQSANYASIKVQKSVDVGLAWWRSG